MAFRYLYIDDFEYSIIEGTITGLESDDLKLIFENPSGEWDTQIDTIQNPGQQIDGIIIDLRLNEGKSISGKTTKYRGPSLAQELRTLAKEKTFVDLPLILLSAEKNLQSSFDITSSDLFDLCISKESLNDALFPIVRKKLIALSNGYISINNLLKETHTNSSLLSHILDLSEEEINEIDSRFSSEIIKLKDQPTHTLAHFLTKQFLSKSGIVVSEKVLAARLGIDINDIDKWETFKTIIDGCKYKGVFASGWDRWWMHKVESWWQNSINCKDSLQSMGASKRIEILNSVLKLDLEVAKPIEMAKSDFFWTICKGLELPLDPSEGLLIIGQEKIFPWQDRDYVSFKEALNREFLHKWKELSSMEKNKYEHLKVIFKRERVKR